MTEDLPPDRRATRAAAVAATCLFIPLLIPLATARVFSLGDLSDFHLPVRYLYHSALAGGHSILWTSQMFGGFYLHAEGQVGAFHPLHLALYRALPLTAAFNLELIASYAFGFAGMWRFLRRFGQPPVAAATGAMAFAFSGFNLLHLLHMNAVAIVAHLPWLLLALDGMLLGDRTRQSVSAAGFAALLGSMLLLGYPQYVWMAALVCLVYVAVLGRQVLMTRLGVAAASAMAGVMLGGIQLLPTADLLSQSVRQEVDRQFALTYSLHPVNLAQLFSPYLLETRVYTAVDPLFVHEFGLYNGVFCTIALIWVLARWRHLPHRRTAAFALALVSVGLVFALGRYGFVYEAVTMLPLVGKFRAPARHIAFVHLGLAILAAMAMADLTRLSMEARRRLHLPWLWTTLAGSVIVAVLVSTWISGAPAVEAQTVSVPGAFISSSLVLLVTLLVADAARGSKAAVAAIPVLLAVDLGLWGYGYVMPPGIEPVSRIAMRAEVPEADPGTRIHPAEAPSPNLGLLRGFAVVRPYVGLYPDRTFDFRTGEELRIAGVEWVQREDGWKRVDDPMPRIRFVSQTLIAPLREAVGASFDPSAALVEYPLPMLTADASAVFVEDTPGSMVIDVTARGDALLATTEAYDHGWRGAIEGGRPVQTVRLYGDYLGVLVPQGTYRLVLDFSPASARRGAIVSVAGLVAAIVLAGLVRRYGADHAVEPLGEAS